jgi:hypothetical protein
LLPEMTRTPTNLMAVIEAFGPGRIGIKRIDFLQVDHVIQLGRKPNRIDILTGISGVISTRHGTTESRGRLPMPLICH